MNPFLNNHGPSLPWFTLRNCNIPFILTSHIELLRLFGNPSSLSTGVPLLSVLGLGDDALAG